MSPAFNPKTGLLYVTAREVCATYYGWEQEFVAGRVLLRRRRTAHRTAATARCARSIPKVAGVKWEFKYYTPSMAGVLSTESGLVFGGDMDGNVMAFEAATGQEPVALPDRLGRSTPRRSPTCSTAGSSW